MGQVRAAVGSEANVLRYIYLGWCEVALRFAGNISGYADMAQAMKRYYQVLLKQYPLPLSLNNNTSLS
jgi:hypothetical protein